MFFSKLTKFEQLVDQFLINIFKMPVYKLIQIGTASKLYCTEQGALKGAYFM